MDTFVNFFFLNFQLPSGFLGSAPRFFSKNHTRRSLCFLHFPERSSSVSLAFATFACRIMEACLPQSLFPVSPLEVLHTSQEKLIAMQKQFWGKTRCIVGSAIVANWLWFFYDCGIFKLLKLEEESWSSLIVLSSAAWFDYTCFHINFPLNHSFPIYCIKLLTRIFCSLIFQC